jgi:hypothetical protein
MEIIDRKKVLLPFDDPFFLVYTLTRRAISIATRVVMHLSM